MIRHGALLRLHGARCRCPGAPRCTEHGPRSGPVDDESIESPRTKKESLKYYINFLPLLARSHTK
eukprot:4950618-Prymnesium_polylepis.1